MPLNKETKPNLSIYLSFSKNTSDFRIKCYPWIKEILISQNMITEIPCIFAITEVSNASAIKHLSFWCQEIFKCSF